MYILIQMSNISSNILIFLNIFWSGYYLWSTCFNSHMLKIKLFSLVNKLFWVKYMVHMQPNGLVKTSFNHILVIHVVQTNFYTSDNYEMFKLVLYISIQSWSPDHYRLKLYIFDYVYTIRRQRNKSSVSKINML